MTRSYKHQIINCYDVKMPNKNGFQIDKYSISKPFFLVPVINESIQLFPISTDKTERLFNEYIQCSATWFIIVSQAPPNLG
jgi:hypothetical protein